MVVARYRADGDTFTYSGLVQHLKSWMLGEGLQLRDCAIGENPLEV